MDNKHIVLVGPMGSGKSTVGRNLSEKTNLNLIDLDLEIEKNLSMKISEIFSTKGEAYFRDVESKILKSTLLNEERSIISTGGGIIMSEANRALIKERAFCIYLYASVDTQFRRTKNDNNRPMILVEDRYTRLKNLFSIRDSLYEDVSVLKINTDHSRIDEIVSCIIDKL